VFCFVLLAWIVSSVERFRIYNMFSETSQNKTPLPRPISVAKLKTELNPLPSSVISYRLTLDDLVYRVPPRTPQLLRMTLFDPLTSQFDPQSTWQNTPSPLPQSRCPFSVVPLAFRANFGFRQHASKSLVPILFPFSSPQRRC
jgi:hypothetical protein